MKRNLIIYGWMCLLIVTISINNPKQAPNLLAQNDVQTIIPVPLFGAFEDATQSSPYDTGAQIINLESETTIVEVVRYNPDGTRHSAIDYTVDANDSLTIFPLDNPAGRDGSIEIRSEQDITAIFNIASEGLRMGGSYAVPQPSTEILLPLLTKDQFVTMFGLQNTNDIEATVSIDYSDGTSREETIPAHTTKYIYQELEVHNTPVFAGSITSNVPLSAAVIQKDADVSFVYSGFTNFSTSPTFPLVNVSGSGYITGIQIQNGGDETTEITLAYTPSAAGTACSETQTIGSGDSATFALFAFEDGSNSTCTGGASLIGSATVTENSTNQPLVGISNQLLPGSNGEAYTSFRAEDATDTVVLPLIMDRNGGFFTGFAIANVGDSLTNVICTFTDSDYTVSGEIFTGGALTHIQSNEIAAGYVGAATCSGDVGSKIVAVVNQLGSGSGDQFYVYEGINR